MKRTKRQENAIVINFILYLILFISFLMLFIYYIIPNILEIEILKSDTQKIYNNKLEIQKKGLSFSEFKENSEKTKLKEYFSDNKDFKYDYILGIINGLDESFYNTNFKNNGNGDYNTFLTNLKNIQKKDTNIEEKLLILNKILPSYSESLYEIKGENSLTDFKFINYLESIFSAFNLSYNNSIGVKDLSILPDYVIGFGDNSLDKNIFYIPIEFDLEGSKLSIINFLHFTENVGKIFIEKPSLENSKDKQNQDGKISIYKENYHNGDDFYNFRNIKLSNDKYVKDYNIFNNQVFSIESISFPDYINSSFEISNFSNKKEESLISFMRKTNQFPEKFQIKVKLRFYVKGQPKYKIEKFILDFKNEFTNTLKDIKKIINNNKVNDSDKIKLENIKKALNTLTSTVNGLNPNAKNITEIYNQAYKYNIFLEEEINKINKIKEKLGNIVK